MNRVFFQQPLKWRSDELMKPEMSGPVHIVRPNQRKAPPKTAARCRWNQRKKGKRCLIAENDVTLARRDPARPLRPVFLKNMAHFGKIQTRTCQVLDTQKNRPILSF
ncbi:MAG: hypothetical protein Q7T21_05975 [Gallionella sp.]|nr:hypothetical protein [Gallionella sp.]